MSEAMFLLLRSGYVDGLRRVTVEPHETLESLYGSERGMNPLLLGARRVESMSELIDTNMGIHVDLDDPDLPRQTAPGAKELRCLIIEYNVIPMWRPEQE